MFEYKSSWLPVELQSTTPIVSDMLEVRHPYHSYPPRSVFQLIFFGKGSCNFSGGGGHKKYSTLIYQSTLADCRFRHCRVR